MRKTYHFNKKISPARPAKTLPINGLYKFVINEQYHVTLRIADAAEFTYTSLMKVLDRQQITHKVEGKTYIQSCQVEIKSQNGVMVSPEAIKFSQDQPISSPQPSKKKINFKVRPISAKRKLFHNKQLDLLQSPKISGNKNKLDVSMSMNLQQSPNRSSSFRLRRKLSATKRERIEIQSSQLIRERIAASSNQSVKQIEKSSPSLSQKKYRRRSNMKITLQRPSYQGTL